jgi:hypothetical protein
MNVKKFTTRITLSANHSDNPDGVEIIDITIEEKRVYGELYFCNVLLNP